MQLFWKKSRDPGGAINSRICESKLAKWMREQMTSHVGTVATPKDWKNQNRQGVHGGGQRSTSWSTFVCLDLAMTMKAVAKVFGIEFQSKVWRRFREVSELVSLIRQRTGLLIASAVPIFGFRRIVSLVDGNQACDCIYVILFIGVYQYTLLFQFPVWYIVYVFGTKFPLTNISGSWTLGFHSLWFHKYRQLEDLGTDFKFHTCDS